jgi:ribose-phosphate pyrophosphokinase
MIVNTDNYAGTGTEVFQFPGGEWHANVLPIPTTEPITFHAKLRTWDDVGKLLAVADAYVSQGHELALFAPYFPGMRQDRNPNGLTPLTVRVYAEILCRYFTNVAVVDPHSAGGVSVLDNYFQGVHVIESTAFLKDLITQAPSHVLIPDKGAVQRSTAVAELFGARTVQAEKVRDFETGQLSGFSVPDLGLEMKVGNRILIPDDICDGGGTFLGLLAQIRKQTSAPVDLFVTHGIFSKGVQVLSGFDNVYTTDSFYDPDLWFQMKSSTPRAKVLNLLPYYTGETE